MNQETFIFLINKYLSSTATSIEREIVEEYYKRLIEKGITELTTEQEQLLQQTMLQNIQNRKDLPRHETATAPVRSIFLLRWRWRIVAASFAGFIILGVVLFHKTKPSQTQVADTNKPYQKDIPPGTNKAILTLADGRRIDLDRGSIGTVSLQAGSRVMKSKEGLLSYLAIGGGSDRITYNTLVTPRGGKYALILPDGSKVWLNAASSLRYPVSFARLKQREVSLTGEGYFEIKHLQSVPFIVHTRTTVIQDIGTRFNVMAYDDEPVQKTTLAEGAIKLTENNKAVILQPGEQGETDRNGSLKIAKVKVDQETSWMHNEFNFYDADLYSVMRQISRWYNVEIAYRGNIPNRLLYGSASRDTKLSTVLHLLSVIHINGRLEGNTVIIEP